MLPQNPIRHCHATMVPSKRGGAHDLAMAQSNPTSGSGARGPCCGMRSPPPSSGDPAALKVETSAVRSVGSIALGLPFPILAAMARGAGPCSGRDYLALGPTARRPHAPPTKVWAPICSRNTSERIPGASIPLRHRATPTPTIGPRRGWLLARTSSQPARSARQHALGGGGPVASGSLREWQAIAWARLSNSTRRCAGCATGVAPSRRANFPVPDQKLVPADFALSAVGKPRPCVWLST